MNPFTPSPRKTLVMLNADPRSDEARQCMLKDLLQQHVNLDLWFYPAGHDYSEFHTPLPETERGPKQIWIHSSAFEDDQELMAWLAKIDPSWLTGAYLVLYSGGSQDEIDQAGFQDWLTSCGGAGELFAPAFPAGPDSPGYGHLRQLVESLSTGADPRRQRLALELLQALMFTVEGPESLAESFAALCRCYPPVQQQELQALWGDYCHQALSETLSALRDRLLTD